MSNPNRIYLAFVLASFSLLLPAQDPPAPKYLGITASAPSPLQPADNSRCFVCHANYEEEPLSMIHANKANAGCIRCHGESSPHSTDEDGLTAPERMYPKSWVRLNCLSCHNWQKLLETDKINASRTDLNDKPDHKKVLDGTATEKRFCTDCHGEHRMYHRTRTWDKRSGILTARDATPQMLPKETKIPASQ